MARVKIKVERGNGLQQVIEIDTGATKGATLGTNVFLPNGQVATPATFLSWLGTAPSSGSGGGGSSGPNINSILKNPGDLLTRTSQLIALPIAVNGDVLRVVDDLPDWALPSALTKVDDTNVTLTLGGAPNTALLDAASLTLGWTGTLAAIRGGTGFGSYAAGDTLYANSTTTLAKLGIGTAGYTMRVSGGAPAWVAPAALTKVDDTNVTLTLGGSPATALLLAASITAGWTGTLAATRGGTGTGTYATGDILYASATNTLSKLAAGTNGFLLTMAAGVPTWASAAGTRPGWTDFGDVPTYVDATHITVPGNQTARYLPFVNILVTDGSSSMQARVVSAAFTTVTTITLSTATVGGGSIPTSPTLLYVQTTHPSDGMPISRFSVNDVTGYQVANANTGSGAAARYAAWTLDSSGVANSAIALVAVAPSYNGTGGGGAYLGGGFPTGTGRGVLYTPPSYPLEIGTSDVAKIKIPAGTTPILFPTNGITVTGPAGSTQQIFVQASSTDDAAITLNTAGSASQWTIKSANTGANLKFRWENSSFDVAEFVTTGGLKINAPGIGAALNAFGVANANTILVTGSATSGQSFGVNIDAGTTSADHCLQARNRSGTKLFKVWGDGGIEIGAPTGGNKGAGTLNAATNMYIANVAVQTVSDRRMKKNIRDAGPAGALIDSIRIHQYEWKKGGEHEAFGAIAQDMVKVFPKAVARGGPDISRPWGIQYGHLMPAVIKELQDLRKRTAALESQLH